MRDGTHTTVLVEVDVRYWHGTLGPELELWLGPELVGVNENVLHVRNTLGMTTAVRPGWALVRYDDGELVVLSPPAWRHILNITEE